MRVLVWGLGYVGTVSAACLARLGNEVIGIEPNASKVAAINSGRSAVKEPDLDALVSQAVGMGRLCATHEGASVIAWADVSLICVGTPSAADGSPVLDYLRAVAGEIGRGLRETSRYHVVVLRSTVFPGTARNLLLPELESHSGRRAGADFGLVCNPEFTREAHAIDDFYKPPYTVIGELDQRSGDPVEELYRPLQALTYRVRLEEAEIVKLANNAFHALKAAYANEMGRLCDSVGIDSHVVMRMVASDHKLNVSEAYLKPGFAFGGSCLPKDLRSLEYHGRRLGVELPVLEAILPSNRLQVEAARVKVHELGARRVAVLGLSFKPKTDDLRESPVIGLIRDLWQDGVDVIVHDPDVVPENMLGSNREYLERQLPQIHEILLSSLDETLRGCQAVVVAQDRPEFADAVRHLNGSAAVLDLVRLGQEAKLEGLSCYHGMSW